MYLLIKLVWLCVFYECTETSVLHPGSDNRNHFTLDYATGSLRSLVIVE